MGYFNQALLFMRAHENLAGWAQAVGTLIALVIAIAIPAYQRHAQLLDARRQQASLNLTQAAAVNLLLNDVVIFLESLLELAGTTRSYCRNDIEMSDLLGRIKSLEDRETSHARVISLYTARGALIIMSRLFRNELLQAAPFFDDERSIIVSNKERVQVRHRLASYDAELAIANGRGIYLVWPFRPVFIIGFRIRAYWRHPDVPWVDRLFGTK